MLGFNGGRDGGGDGLGLQIERVREKNDNSEKGKIGLLKC